MRLITGYAFQTVISDIVQAEQLLESTLYEQDTKLHFVTYAHGAAKHYDKTLPILLKSARATGWFTSVHGFKYESLSKSFRDQYYDILQYPKGAGYWIWKLEVMRIMLSQIDEGDFLVYTDAGCVINPLGKERLQTYINAINDSQYDALSFILNQPENKWTTNRIFSYFNVSEDSPIRHSNQYMSTVHILQKGNHSRLYLKIAFEALRADRWMFSDRYNAETMASRGDTFIDNRHDQSILSIIRKLIGSVTFPDGTWPLNIPTEPFWASRRRD